MIPPDEFRRLNRELCIRGDAIASSLLGEMDKQVKSLLITHPHRMTDDEMLRLGKGVSLTVTSKLLACSVHYAVDEQCADKAVADHIYSKICDVIEELINDL